MSCTRTFPRRPPSSATGICPDLEVARKVLDGKRALVVPAYPDPTRKPTSGALLGYPLRVSEDQRGMQPLVQLLRHPVDPWSAPFPAAFHVQDEMEDLVSHGVKEINLIAQDLAPRKGLGRAEPFPGVAGPFDGGPGLADADAVHPSRFLSRLASFLCEGA
jgi:hypothetical protein